MKLLNKFKISLPPLPTAPPAHAPQQATLFLLAGLVACAVLSHFYLGHAVIASYGVIVWLLKAATIARRGPRLPRWLLIALTILSFVLVLVFYGGWNGQKAGISFLVLLAALKFLESRSLRDYQLVCLILLFLASSSFLFNSSLVNVAIILCYTIGIVTVMLRLSDPGVENHLSPLKNSSVILLKALPLAILLFFFFPRIHGSFGFIPSQDENGAENQLNNSLVAGDFANSAFSNEPAFRVEFESDIPPNHLLYWRAKVMVDERNFAWQVRAPKTNDLRLGRAQKKRSADQNDTVRYQIVHEPSEDDYLPYLDYALNPATGIQLEDMSVYRFQKGNGIFAYSGAATIRPNLPQSDQFSSNKSKLLNTTSLPTARLQALIISWRNKAKSKKQLVEVVLQYLKENEFKYSLAPPGLGANPIDEFLFETRSGYCEHYASSFTILMRWLGIPARVVVGYQGGTRNLAGNYLQVRYSDAHAWSEVWLDGQWHRYDPTTMASLGEQRISQGMSALLSLWDIGGWDSWSGGTSLANSLQPTGYKLALKHLQDNWDNIGYQWNKWVINYDFDAQKALLAKLGFEHRNSLYTLLALLITSTFGLMLFYFSQLIPKAVRLGEAQQAYLQFVTRLKRFKLIKARAETPLEFARRASDVLPWHADQIRSITNEYVELRYGRDPGSINQFKRRVKHFKPHNKLRSA